MASISLLLTSKNVTDKTSVFMYCRAVLLKYPTGVSVKPKQWDSKTQLIKGVVPEKEANNAALKRCKEAGTVAIAEILASGQELTKELLRDRIDLLLGKKELPNNSLVGFAIAHTNRAKTQTNTAKGIALAPKTIAKYNTTISILKHFDSLRGKPTQFTELSTDWINDFKDFLTTTKQYKINTIEKYIKQTKVFIREAMHQSLHDNRNFESKYWSAPTEVVQSVYLTTQELALLHHAKGLSESQKKARDLFLLEAYTGLRYSDVSKLSAIDLGADTIEIRVAKTNEKLVSFINPSAREIITRNGGKAPEAISNQKLNKYIKDVCQKVGIDTPMEVQETKAGLRITKHLPKWQLVSTHTGRRSFATNLYLQGFPIKSIMAATGHKTEKAFNAYIRLTPNEHAKLLKLHHDKLIASNE
jgi:integrase